MGARGRSIIHRKTRIALAATGFAIAAIGATVLLYRSAGPTPSLAALEQLTVARDTAAALDMAARLLPDHANDAALPEHLHALYALLTDPATGEPDPQHAGAPARGVAVSLQAALKDIPGTAGQHAALGEFALVAGFNRRAAQALRQAEALGRPAAYTRLPLALALLRDGQPEALLAAIDPAAAPTPHRQSLLWTLRARAHLALAQPAAARTDFTAALAAEPGNLDALSRFGQMELWHGAPATAAALLARAQALAPQAPPTLRLAGEYAYATGDHRASARAYDALIRQGAAERFDPIPPSLGKARALIYASDLTAAAAALDAAPLAADDATVTYYRALLAYRAGEFGDAAGLAQGLDDRIVGYPPLDLLVGGAMLATGFPETATSRLRRYLQATPGNSVARELLDTAERLIDDPTGAAVAPAQLHAAFGFPRTNPGMANPGMATRKDAN
jgi:Tfp pilus assembly protein PilF